MVEGSIGNLATASKDFLFLVEKHIPKSDVPFKYLITYLVANKWECAALWRYTKSMFVASLTNPLMIDIHFPVLI